VDRNGAVTASPGFAAYLGSRPVPAHLADRVVAS